MCSGVKKSDLKNMFGSGHAVSDSSHIALTHKGINISNKIMALFVWVCDRRRQA